MQGRSGTRAGLVYLLAGAALGAAVVLVLWIYSGGKPFGEVVGSTAVSSPTPAAVQPSAPQERAGTPASAAARLESEPPAIGRSRELRFTKERAAKAEKAKAKRKARRNATKRKPVVRVVAPPPSTEAADEEELPVAVVPSPAPTAAPPKPAAPPASGGGGGTAKPKPSGPTLWAGEG